MSFQDRDSEVSCSGESSGWFPSPLFAPTSCQNSCAHRPLRTVNRRRPPGAREKFRMRTLESWCRNQSWCRNHGAEVLGLSLPMFFLLDKSKTTDKVRLNRFNLKISRV